MNGFGTLLHRQTDVQPDGFASRLGGAAVGGFHNAWTAAGADHEAAVSLIQVVRPFGKAMRELASFGIVTPAGAGLEGSRRAEEHDRVADLLLPEVRERIEVFAQKAQRPGIGRIQELLVPVSERQASWNIGGVNHVGNVSPIVAPSSAIPAISGTR